MNGHTENVNARLSEELLNGVTSLQECRERHREYAAGREVLRCTLHFRVGSITSVERSRHVGFTPDSGRMAATQLNDASGHLLPHATQQTASLFDHLVGAHEKRLWDRPTESFGGRKIDNEFEFSRLLDRKVFRLGAVEDLDNQTRPLSIDR